MCRTGGRRCPSYSDPVAIAARNARRRAAYAAKKAAKKAEQASAAKTVESIAQEVATPPTQTAAKKTAAKETAAKKTAAKKTAARGTHKKSTKQAAGTATVSKIGVSRTPVQADLHYAPQVVRGVVNHKALNEESYREFGFADPRDEEPLYQRNRPDDIFALYSEKESKRECAALNDLERQSVRYFTTSNYSWINDKLFRPERMRSLPPETPESRERAKKIAQDLTCAHYERGRSLLREVTSNLDSALAKGPGKQRFVYRGIAAGEILGVDDSVVDVKVPRDIAEQWVDENRSLGTEVVFDGYTSATARASAAASFQKGVVYEILTPQGMAISTVSEAKREDEVLLPRKQRYMVVGVHKNQTFDKYTTGTIIQLVAINSKGEVLDGTNADPIDPVDVELQ